MRGIRSNPDQLHDPIRILNKFKTNCGELQDARIEDSMVSLPCPLHPASCILASHSCTNQIKPGSLRLTVRRTSSGDHTGKETPVPIPNTAVKLSGPMIVPTSAKVGIARFYSCSAAPNPAESKRLVRGFYMHPHLAAGQ